MKLKDFEKKLKEEGPDAPGLTALKVEQLLMLLLAQNYRQVAGRPEGLPE